jgi:hypothetical protein
MPTIMSTGRLRLPVRYRSWGEWRLERPADGALAAVPGSVPAEFCAGCWGQGRILRAAPNGEGLVPDPCGACAATGAAPSR